MNIFDRILNRNVAISEIQIPIILGRYIFMSDQSAVKLNDCDIKRQDYLVPSKLNEGTVIVGSDKRKLFFEENDLLNESVSSLIKHTLFDISDELNISNDFVDSTNINVLLRNFDERLEVTPFESYLQKKLFHIEEICRAPSSYLKRDIAKVNVSRAQKIPVKAINYLASHTEDWSRRRIRSVEPRKILTEIIDSDLKIYENQVTASLIDQLLIYFSHRMFNEIDVIDSFIVNIEQIIESRKRGDSSKNLFWYKKLDKDYEKLGKAVASIEASRVKIDGIKDFISSIQMRLYRLLKSDLYVVSSKSKMMFSQKLKRTNLFDSHQNYRYIKILWDRYHKKESFTNSQKSEENQKLIRSYFDYSSLLVFRALSQVGFDQIEKKNETDFLLTNQAMPKMSIRVVLNENQLIDVDVDNQEKFTFIPLPSTTSKFKSYPPQKTNNFYFSLAGSEDREDIVVISPTDINSEECISHILFKVILKIYTASYLFKLDSQLISQFRILSLWLQKNHSLILDKGANDKIDFWLKRKLNQYELKELDTIIIKQKQKLSVQTAIREKELCKMKNIFSDLTIKGRKHFEEYETCISCSVKNPSNLKPNNEGGFKYQCNNKDCKVEYGITDIGNFYKVPSSDKIRMNISQKGKVINDSCLLNAFGYEYI